MKIYHPVISKTFKLQLYPIVQGASAVKRVSLFFVGSVVFGYPLATCKNKKTCKSATYRTLFVLEAGLEPAQLQ